MAEERQAMCSYCRRYKPISLLQTIKNHPAYNVVRRICEPCRDRRSMSRSEIDALTAREKADRRAADAARQRDLQRELADKRRKDPT